MAMNTSEILKHPLILLMTGAILSTFLIPYIQEGLSQDENKRDIMLELYKENGDIISQSNKIFAIIQMYEHRINIDSISKQEADEVRKEYQTLYRDEYLKLVERVWTDEESMRNKIFFFEMHKEDQYTIVYNLFEGRRGFITNLLRILTNTSQEAFSKITYDEDKNTSHHWNELTSQFQLLIKSVGDIGYHLK